MTCKSGIISKGMRGIQTGTLVATPLNVNTMTFLVSVLRCVLFTGSSLSHNTVRGYSMVKCHSILTPSHSQGPDGTWDQGIVSPTVRLSYIFCFYFLSISYSKYKQKLVNIINNGKQVWRGASPKEKCGFCNQILNHSGCGPDLY